MMKNIFIVILLMLFCGSVSAQIDLTTNFKVASAQPIDTRDTLTTLADTVFTAWTYPGLASYVQSLDEYWYYNGSYWSKQISNPDSSIYATVTYVDNTITGTGIGNGDPNYFPYWVTADSLSGTSPIYTDGSNVGVGTNEIETNFANRASLKLGSGGLSLIAVKNNPAYSSFGAIASNAYLDSGGTWRYIEGGGTYNQASIYGTDGGIHSWSVATNAASDDDPITWNSVMRITNAGNVGIGTTSPSHKLDVVGDIEFYNYRNGVNTTGNPVNVLSTDPTGVLQSHPVSEVISAVGGVTGTSVADRVAYWNSSSSLTGSSKFVWDGTALRIGATSFATNALIELDATVDGKDWLLAAKDTTGFVNLLIYSNTGAFVFGAGPNYPTIGSGSSSGLSKSGSSMIISSRGGTNIGGNTSYFVSQTPFTRTNATEYGIASNYNFSPPFGTVTQSYFTALGTINQTGGANGITRGFHANNTLTSAADYRAFEASNTTGKGFWQTGSSVINHFNGNVGIATASPSQKLHVVGNTYTTAQYLADPIGSTSAVEYSFLGDEDTGMGTAAANTLRFITGNAEALRIEPDHDVVIQAGSLFLPTTTSTDGIIYSGGSRFIYTIGTYNDFFGLNSGNFTVSGIANTALGNSSLISISTGNYNSAVGWRSAYLNTTGFENVALGAQAMRNNLTGNQNTAVGVNSLFSFTTGSNTAIGYSSASSATTGTYNVVVGANAAKYDASGSTPSDEIDVLSQSVFIGGLTRALDTTSTNEIVIGYSVVGNGSNTATIGNGSITDNYFNGNLRTTAALKIGTTATLTDNGTIRWTGTDFEGRKGGVWTSLTSVSNLPDGDYGDISISSGVWGIDNDAVTLADMASGTANRLIGYDVSGNPTEITAGANISISGGVISSTGGAGGGGGVYGSGMPGEVSYWVNDSTLTSTTLFAFDGTNLGIGTNAPTKSLDVVSTSRFRSDIYGSDNTTLFSQSGSGVSSNRDLSIANVAYGRIMNTSKMFSWTYNGLHPTLGTWNFYVNAGTAATGAGTSTYIKSQNAASGSNLNGGNIYFLPGSKDGSGVDGFMGFNTTSPKQKFDFVSVGTGGLMYNSYYNTTLTLEPKYILFKSHSGSESNVTTPVATELGTVEFAGVNTSNAYSAGARITAYVSNSAGTTLPTELRFETSPGAGTLPQQRMVIEAEGDVGIGVANPLNNLHVDGAIQMNTGTSSANNGTIRWSGSDFEGRKGGAWVSLTASGSDGNGVFESSNNLDTVRVAKSYITDQWELDGDNSLIRFGSDFDEQFYFTFTNKNAIFMDTNTVYLGLEDATRGYFEIEGLAGKYEGSNFTFGNKANAVNPEVRFTDSLDAQYYAFKAPANITSNYTEIFPTTGPSVDGSYKSYDVDGTTQWVNPLTSAHILGDPFDATLNYTGDTTATLVQAIRGTLANPDSEQDAVAIFQKVTNNTATSGVNSALYASIKKTTSDANHRAVAAFFEGQDNGGDSGGSPNSYVEGARAHGIVNANGGSGYGLVGVAGNSIGSTWKYLNPVEGWVQNNGADQPVAFDKNNFSASFVATSEGTGKNDAGFMTNPFNGTLARRGFFVPLGSTDIAAFDSEDTCLIGINFGSAAFTYATMIMPNSVPIYSKNGAGSADRNIMYLNSSDELALGQGADHILLNPAETFVGIGSNTPVAKFDVNGSVSAPAGGFDGMYSRYSGVNITDNTTAAADTNTAMVSHSFAAPTFNATNSSVTIQNGVNVYIAGPPAEGNVTINTPYSLLVDAGTSRFDGQILGAVATNTVQYAFVGATDWGMNLAASALRMVVNDIDYIEMYEQDAADTGRVVINRRLSTSEGGIASIDSTLNLNNAGNFFIITGGTSLIKTILTDGWTSGDEITLKFTTTLTIYDDDDAVHTGGNILLANNDDVSTASTDGFILKLIFDGTNWNETSRSAN